ncbi:MAG: hypothetical protein AAGC72_16780 [Planctomycetota bacterium]
MKWFRLCLLALCSLVALGVADFAAAEYSPRMGRFMQRDPLGYPDGMNSYAAYHVMYQGLDPSGMDDIRKNKEGHVHHVPEWATGWDRWDEATYLGQVGADGRITFDPALGLPPGRPLYSKIERWGGFDDFCDVRPRLEREANDAIKHGNREQARRQARAELNRDPEIRSYNYESERSRAPSAQAAAALQAGGEVVYIQGAKAAATAPVGTVTVKTLTWTYRGGRAALNMARAGDDVAGTGLTSLRSGIDGSNTAIARYVDDVPAGQNIDDLINDMKGQTWVKDAEHALVTLTCGRRVIVSGGRDGIDFITDDSGKLFVQVGDELQEVKRIMGHTHPSPTGPSQDDFDTMKALGQQRTYISEVGAEAVQRVNSP